MPINDASLNFREQGWNKFTIQPEPISCPSCGHESAVHEFDFMGETVYWVACSHCGLRTNQSPSRERVIKTWNRRDGDKILAQKVDEYARAKLNEILLSVPPPIDVASSNQFPHTHQVPTHHSTLDPIDRFNFFLCAR